MIKAGHINIKVKNKVKCTGVRVEKALHKWLAGCKENHFYSLPFGQAEASIYMY